jgi:hypothetical protein
MRPYCQIILEAGFPLYLSPLRLRHVHNMPDVLVFSALVPKAFGAKVSSICMTDARTYADDLWHARSELWRPPSKASGKISVGFADLVITVNLACKRIYSSRGCRPDKIAVIMNAPEDQVFASKAGPRT